MGGVLKVPKYFVIFKLSRSTDYVVTRNSKPVCCPIGNTYLVFKIGLFYL